MFVRNVAVVITRSRDEVFAFIADARNRPRWDDTVDSEELTSPEPIGVGTTVRTKLRSMGRDYEYTWEVVEHQPPDRQTIESTSGPMSTTLVYRLDPGDDQTTVRFAVTGRPTGLLRLLQPLIARTTQRNLDRGFCTPEGAAGDRRPLASHLARAGSWVVTRATAGKWCG